MKLFRHTDNLPPDVMGAVIAWGNFDGFHKGHQAVLHQTAQIADDIGAPLAALTTEPHPREYFAPDAPPFRLMTLRNKAHALETFGVDTLFVLSFDETLANTSAEAFIRNLLVGKLGARHIVTGYDQRFGRARTGDTDLLVSLGEELGYAVTVIDPVQHGEVVYSSTEVRNCLREGQPEAAAELMGHWWRVEGRIEQGDQRGRTIGFPTANVHWDGYVEPQLGVYAVHWVDWWTILLGLSFVAVTLFAPKGIGGLFDLFARVRAPERHGANGQLSPPSWSLMFRAGTTVEMACL